MNINWNLNENDMNLVDKISRRAVEQLGANKMDTMMDITAAHLNDCELDLEKLLKFDDFNFAHDIHGIRGHIDTNTGKLTRGFLPRCTK
ncbi:hypothetical protein LJB95_00010 [Paludibacteraceae bacterium OttesenSCG-928-F17]|nr:hypothetical protein [Paludibacteraceae bacterium OttesenSCG-928-F17]